MKRIWVVLVLLAGCRPEPVFESDFRGVTVTPPYQRYGQWWQGLEGGGWPDGLPVPATEFQLQVKSEVPHPQRYVQQRVISAQQRDGKVGPVLFQAVYGPVPDDSWMPRSNYLLRPPPDFTEAYQESWLYFQPRMDEYMALGGGTRRQIWEIKCHPNPGDDAARFIPSFRYYVTIHHDRINGLHWRAEGEHRPHAGNFGDYEFRYGKHVGDLGVGVPVGRWFPFEVYWKSSAGADGRFVVRVDRKVLCDYTGPTRTTTPVDKLNLIKLYVDPQHLKDNNYAAWMMVDDIVIYADAEQLP
jgi:hypothetical protein